MDGTTDRAAGRQWHAGLERLRKRTVSRPVDERGRPRAARPSVVFGAYQYLRDFDNQSGTDPAFPRRYEQNKFFAKLNWKLTQSLQMMQSFHQEAWVNPTPPTLAAPFVTTQRVHASVVQHDLRGRDTTSRPAALRLRQIQAYARSAPLAGSASTGACEHRQ